MRCHTHNQERKPFGLTSHNAMINHNLHHQTSTAPRTIHSKQPILSSTVSLALQPDFADITFTSTCQFYTNTTQYVNSMTRTFTFQAGARPVFARTKFREETEGERIACHISVDPRVARGSVYSHHKPPKDTVQPIRYRPRAIPKPKEELMMMEEEEIEEQEPLPDLMEIEDRPIEDDLATAAETYIERPPTPHFVPDEPGVDVATQVYHGDLFNFDLEVKPLIKTIVQHTLLRAMAEVYEEVEVENIAKHRDRYEVERNTILSELQRLEAKEQRKFEEDKRRREQREKYIAASAGFAESFAADTMMGAMDLLERRGTFYDEVEKEVSDAFLPWVANELEGALAVKDKLYDIKKRVARKADDVRRGRKKAFKKDVATEKKDEKAKEVSIMRRMLIEDLGSAKIRQTRKEYRERKEREAREAAEAAARAEEEELERQRAREEEEEMERRRALEEEEQREQEHEEQNENEDEHEDENGDEAEAEGENENENESED